MSDIWPHEWDVVSGFPAVDIRPGDRIGTTRHGRPFLARYLDPSEVEAVERESGRLAPRSRRPTLTVVRGGQS